MSLYANLLKKKDPTAPAPATISSEPVKYSFKKAEDESKEEKKAPDAALRFQPSIKRPNPQAQFKARPRPSLPSAHSASPDKQSNPSDTASASHQSASANDAPSGDAILDWINPEADNQYISEFERHKQLEKERARESKKRRNKKKNQHHEVVEQDWNAIYNPEQPIRLELYHGSLEEIDAKYEWKQRLHAHEKYKRNQEAQAAAAAAAAAVPPPPIAAVAPAAAPALPSFAPPASYEPVSDRQEQTTSYNRAPPPASFDSAGDGDDDYEPPPAAPTPPVAPSNQPSFMHGVPQIPPPPTGQLPPFLPHLQHLAAAQGLPIPPSPWQLPPGGFPPPPPGMPFPIPGMSFPPPAPGMFPPIPPQGMPIPPPPPGMPGPPPPHFIHAQTPAHLLPATTPTPPAPSPADPVPPPQSQSGPVISRAPVMFSQPAPTPENAEEPTQRGGLGSASSAAEAASNVATESPERDEQPRSKVSGQPGFARRLLQKYGWKEGQGLGADNSGITTILQHQTQKRKKKADAEGGGFAGPAIGRIVGGKKRKIEGQQEDDNDSDAWSIVARFEGMLKGLDIDAEMMDGDLMQRMGEKMAEYGHVERLYIHRDNASSSTTEQQQDENDAPVFVKFTSALSAYRAVQASQGQDFLGNGRLVKSGFWNEDKFAEGVYE
ncbi:hypothetical protein AAFC00_004479 [Neodothiora populina]|uniref:G-patch domain-containing protein n=1 Tax=Neodothiora populina TaxID=2781224 RepID=A0ABR3P2C6_9PEZI